MQYQPKVGSEFSGEAEVIRAKTAYLRERVRSIIVLTVLVCCVAALGAAAVVSVLSSNASVLAYTWAAMATFVGLPLAYYFGKRNTDDEDDNAGAIGAP